MSPDWCSSFLIFDPRVVAFFVMSLFIRLEPTFLYIYYTTFKPLTCQICGYFSCEYIQYTALTRSIFAAQNPPNIVWRLGSAQTCWERLQRSLEPLVGYRGLLLRERKRAERGRGNRVGVVDRGIARNLIRGIRFHIESVLGHRGRTTT